MSALSCAVFPALIYAAFGTVALLVAIAVFAMVAAWRDPIEDQP